MTAGSEARKAAEERYPRGRGEVAFGPGAVRWARIEAFERGFEAGQAARTSQITEEMVDAAAKELVRLNDMTDWPYLSEYGRGQYRRDARAALEAALGQTNDTKEMN